MVKIIYQVAGGKPICTAVGYPAGATTNSDGTVGGYIMLPCFGTVFESGSLATYDSSSGSRKCLCDQGYAAGYGTAVGTVAGL